MNKLFHLGWRNVWRNRRRSMITVGALIFSILIIALMRSLQYGMYDTLQGQSVNAFAGEIQIHGVGFMESSSFSDSFQDSDEWELAIKGLDLVAGRRVSGFGLISSDHSSKGGMIIGIEPEKERQITTFSDAIIEGEALKAGGFGQALIGYKLAESMNLTVGDTISALTQGYRSITGADLYHIRGIVKTADMAINQAGVIIGLEDAQYLFGMEGRLTAVVLSGTGLRYAKETVAKITSNLPADEYEVLDWQLLLPEIQQAVLIDDIGGMIFIGFLAMLIAFEIFNTATMSIMERIREFGILQAIGLKPGQIRQLITIELLLKVVISITFGAVALQVMLFALDGLYIPLPEDQIEMMAEFGQTLEGLAFYVGPEVWKDSLGTVVVVTLIAILYPIYRSGSFTPADAFRKA